MSKIVIPNNQELYPTPNEHLHFEFSNSIEEYRTSRYLNNILKMFGPDAIIRGLDVRNISWSGNNIIIEINAGALIQDSTLIVVKYSVVFTHTGLSNACINNSNYYPIIYTRFQYSPVTSTPSSNPHSLTMKFGILDTTSNKIYNGDPNTANELSWDSSVNRIIIHAAPITDPCNVTQTVNIHGTDFRTRGPQVSTDPLNYGDIPCFSADGGVI